MSVSRGYGTNALNQYTSSGDITLGYDARGNLISSGSVLYGYTARNLMFKAGGNSFFYDALGRLDIDSRANQNLLYAASQLLKVNDASSGATTERYVYAQGEAPIVSYDANNTRRWLYTDERGTVVALADDAGNAQALNAYDEFGIPAGNNTGRFQYTGQQWLPSAGLSYYKARMYSPALGRFMQTDPIGYDDGLNWYNYAGGDPVNAIDSAGTCKHPNGGQCPDQGSDLLPADYSDIVVNGNRIPRVDPFESISRLANIVAAMPRELGSLIPSMMAGTTANATPQNVSFGPCKPSPLATCTNPVDSAVYANILRKHYFVPKSNKSVFDKWVLNPTAFMVAVGNILENPYKTIAPGVREYTGNVGWVVGTDRYTGQSTGDMTVIIQNNNSPDGFWSVANAYPGNP